MSDLFDRAFDLIIGHEGGYVNDPSDPGGETKFGISKRSYPHIDIRNLTLRGAKDIYRLDYWDANRCDELPWGYAITLFDMGVNQSNRDARLAFQKALGTIADGLLGPKTMAVVDQANFDETLKDFTAWRAVDYARNPKRQRERFGFGWYRRLLSTYLEALDQPQGIS